MVSPATRDNRIWMKVFRSWYVTAASLQSGYGRSVETFTNIHALHSVVANCRFRQKKASNL